MEMYPRTKTNAHLIDSEGYDDDEIDEETRKMYREYYSNLYKYFGIAFWVVVFVFCNYVTIFYSFVANHSTSLDTWYATMTVLLFLIIMLYLAHRFFDCLAHYGDLR
mmetsp:Transcript_17548/g.26290  ORF Transcript_17548/g.26290 Transcript_17548/m.26290 type:complete len:107 (-) Transcript_17548:250-570(-)